MSAVYRVKKAVHDPVPQAIRRSGDLEIHVDKPRGTVRSWDTPEGKLTHTLPVDYGYLPGHEGEDKDPLDFFVGSDTQKGWHGSFHKKAPVYERGQRVGAEPDETKYFTGLTPEEHAEVLKLYGGPSDLVANHRFFSSLPGLQGALARHRMKTSAHKTKVFLGYSFKIDRPEGFVKKWDSGKEFTYPCDYGYFPKLKGEDGEGLDAFVGDDPKGNFESFLKLKPGDDGKMVPDETKFLLGVTDADRKKIYDLYGDEVSEKKIFESMADAMKAAEKFKGKTRFAKKAEVQRSLDEKVLALLQGETPVEDVPLAFARPENDQHRNRVLGMLEAAKLFGVKTGHRANPYGRVDSSSLQTDKDEEFDAAPDFWQKRAFAIFS